MENSPRVILGTSCEDRNGVEGASRCAVINATAIGYAHQLEIGQWESKIIDNIIIQGNSVFLNLSLDGQTLRLQDQVPIPAMISAVFLLLGHSGGSRRVFSYLALKESLQEFLESDEKYAVFSLYHTSMAFIRSGNLIWIFDCQKNDQEGRRINVNSGGGGEGEGDNDSTSTKGQGAACIKNYIAAEFPREAAFDLMRDCTTSFGSECEKHKFEIVTIAVRNAGEGREPERWDNGCPSAILNILKAPPLNSNSRKTSKQPRSRSRCRRTRKSNLNSHQDQSSYVLRIVESFPNLQFDENTSRLLELSSRNMSSDLPDLDPREFEDLIRFPSSNDLVLPELQDSNATDHSTNCSLTATYEPISSPSSTSSVEILKDTRNINQQSHLNPLGSDIIQSFCNFRISSVSSSINNMSENERSLLLQNRIDISCEQTLSIGLHRPSGWLNRNDHPAEPAGINENVPKIPLESVTFCHVCRGITFSLGENLDATSCHNDQTWRELLTKYSQFVPSAENVASDEICRPCVTFLISRVNLFHELHKQVRYYIQKISRQPVRQPHRCRSCNFEDDEFVNFVHTIQNPFYLGVHNFGMVWKFWATKLKAPLKGIPKWLCLECADCLQSIHLKTSELKGAKYLQGIEKTQVDDDNENESQSPLVFTENRVLAVL